MNEEFSNNDLFFTGKSINFCILTKNLIYMKSFFVCLRKLLKNFFEMSETYKNYDELKFYKK